MNAEGGWGKETSFILVSLFSVFKEQAQKRSNLLNLFKNLVNLLNLGK